MMAYKFLLCDKNLAFYGTRYFLTIVENTDLCWRVSKKEEL